MSRGPGERSMARLEPGAVQEAQADLAANPRQRHHLEPGRSLVVPEMIARLEAVIDRRVAERLLQPLFVVPGINLSSAALDVARTAVRRA